jgi:hypothetical protein
LSCSCSSNLSSFWFIIKQQWTIEEISISSNSRHLEWKAKLSDTILKGTHPRTIPARFSVIWFSGFRGEDLNVIFYQNIPNLHNRYKSTERKIYQKNPEYMLNYSLPCSCSYNLSSFWLILKQIWTIKILPPLFTIFTWRPSWLEVGITGHNFGRGPSKDHSTKVWFKLAQWLQRSWLKCEKLTDGRTDDRRQKTDAQWWQ